LATKDNIALLE